MITDEQKSQLEETFGSSDIHNTHEGWSRAIEIFKMYSNEDETFDISAIKDEVHVVVSKEVTLEHIQELNSLGFSLDCKGRFVKFV